METNPIRCYEGNAKPHEPFWRVRNAGEGENPEVELYGAISEYSWLEDDITPKIFKDDLYTAGKGGPVTLRINSYGGDVIAASLMHTIIRDYPGEVTVKIDGVAASAATIVAMAGDKVQIQNTGYFMVHDPSMVFFMASLNIDDLTKITKSLEAVKEGIINAYEAKTGLSRTRLSKLMTDETWMDAQKAKELGFVDEIAVSEKTVISIPKNTAIVNALQNYANVPNEILEAVLFDDQPNDADSSGPVMSDDMKREVQALREKISSILRKEKEHA